jgi:hypothetical protein
MNTLKNMLKRNILKVLMILSGVPPENQREAFPYAIS